MNQQNTQNEQVTELLNEKKIIADVILNSYTPGTLEQHDGIIEIEDFVDLWTADRPILYEIEKTMEILGFKKRG